MSLNKNQLNELKLDYSLIAKEDPFIVTMVVLSLMQMFNGESNIMGAADKAQLELVIAQMERSMKHVEVEEKQEAMKVLQDTLNDFVLQLNASIDEQYNT